MQKLRKSFPVGISSSLQATVLNFKQLIYFGLMLIYIYIAVPPVSLEIKNSENNNKQIDESFNEAYIYCYS